MSVQKYYAVWDGRATGVFNIWEVCKKQIDGFPGTVYKSFSRKQDALLAFANGSVEHIGKAKFKSAINEEEIQRIGLPILESISVDGAWNTSTGKIEYQGVVTKNKKKIFSQGPFEAGTNNVAEFLAIVHALAYCKAQNILLPIYSDSRNAISWVKAKKAMTKLVKSQQTYILFDLIGRAENWLIENNYSNKLVKWETKFWGENPADFNRK